MVLKTIDRSLKKSPGPVLWVVAGSLIAGIVLLDVFLGAKISLVSLQWLPIAFATWYCGAAGGVAMSLVAVGASIVLHRADRPLYWTGETLVWDAVIRTSSNLFFVWVLAKLQSTMASEAEVRREAQDAAKRLRASMLTLVSREIENAITVLDTTLYLAHDGQAREADGGRSWTTMAEVVRHMQTASRDFLAEARMQTARLSEKLEKVALPALIADSIAPFAPLVAQRGVRLSVEAPAETPGVWADKAALTLVVSNLLRNALKYTPAGGSIRIAAGRDGAAAPGVRVIVADDGRGLDASKLSEVNAPDRSGSDPGLRLVRELLRLHNSILDIESAPGDGAKFSFVLTEVSRP
jgi:signal transduction histidine kinase